MIKYFSRQILAFFSLTIVLFCFQNCSDGFNSAVQSTAENSQGNNNPPIPNEPSAGSSAKTNPYSCTTQTVGVENLRRLSRPEIENTLRALLGNNIYNQIQDSVRSLYEDKLLKSHTDFTHQVNDVQMLAYSNIASRILDVFVAQPSLIGELGLSCATQATITNACRDQLINQLGLKALRRPLTAAELTSLRDQVYSLGSSNAERVGLVLYKLVLSPSFLIRVERGDGTNSASEYYLTAYEVASRLSYMITNSPPDDALYAAAAANQLSTVEQIKPHVDRLFATNAAKEKIRSFFDYWLQPKSLTGGNYASDFASGINVDAMSAENLREMKEFIDYIVFTRNGTLSDLITSRAAFPRTSTVANILGAAQVSGANSGPSQTDMSRMGILMRPSVIATDGNEVHSIVRGAKFRSRFLCESLGVPTGVALAGDLSFSGDAAKTQYSSRTRTESLTGSTSCQACHSSINPVGFVFGNFDNFGRYIASEKSYSSNGQVLASHAVNPNVTIRFAFDENEKNVSSGVEYVGHLAARNRLPSCFAEQMHRYYRIRAQTSQDSCVQRDVYHDLVVDANTSLLDAFKKQVLNVAIFKRRTQ